MQWNFSVHAPIAQKNKHMRIAFVGKGGSGKTTLAALFARHLTACGKSVLAIDADINQHLAQTLGFPTERLSSTPALGADIPFIKNFLHGTNPRIADAAMMMKTTPPGTGSRLISLNEPNPIFEKFVREREGIRLIATGSFADADLGVSCYHSKTGAVELLLNHLLDRKGEYVVVDMTAGADAFASGLFAAFDLTVIVIEPTWKSAEVLDQYRRYSEGFATPILVVGNKIADDADRIFAEKKGAETYLAESAWIKASERNGGRPLSELEARNLAALITIREKLDAIKKDWSGYLRLVHMFHRKNAASWANASYGTDLSTQIDPDFTYPITD